MPYHFRDLYKAKNGLYMDRSHAFEIDPVKYASEYNKFMASLVDAIKSGKSIKSLLYDHYTIKTKEPVYEQVDWDHSEYRGTQEISHHIYFIDLRNDEEILDDLFFEALKYQNLQAIQEILDSEDAFLLTGNIVKALLNNNECKKLPVSTKKQIFNRLFSGLKYNYPYKTYICDINFFDAVDVSKKLLEHFFEKESEEYREIKELIAVCEIKANETVKFLEAEYAKRTRDIVAKFEELLIGSENQVKSLLQEALTEMGEVSERNTVLAYGSIYNIFISYLIKIEALEGAFAAKFKNRFFSGNKKSIASQLRVLTRLDLVVDAKHRYKKDKALYASYLHLTNQVSLITKRIEDKPAMLIQENSLEFEGVPESIQLQTQKMDVSDFYILERTKDVVEKALCLDLQALSDMVEAETTCMDKMLVLAAFGKTIARSKNHSSAQTVLESKLNIARDIKELSPLYVFLSEGTFARTHHNFAELMEVYPNQNLIFYLLMALERYMEYQLTLAHTIRVPSEQLVKTIKEVVIDIYQNDLEYSRATAEENYGKIKAEVAKIRQAESKVVVAPYKPKGNAPSSSLLFAQIRALIVPSHDVRDSIVESTILKPSAANRTEVSAS